MMSDATWRNPVKWNRAAERAGRSALVFCASMADVFEIHPVAEINAQLDAARARLWALIGQTPWLTWQLLTKRPENIAALAPWGDAWPDNVWMGTSVEDQQRADERIPILARIPAAVRFLSCEPLLGPVDLSCGNARPGLHAPCDGLCDGALIREVGWLVCGGESGPKFRPLDLDHARRLRDQSVATGTPYFFKQVGGATPKAGGRLLDGVLHDAMPERVR